ncbi:MAG: aminodeoxychorismate lyase [Gammaproteobacteria bacterium]|nr:aminodeoxychorismate lyase [Gammaproteobacteria bacterium]
MATELTLSLVNGIAADSVSIKERALNYGDGVFETIAVHNRRLHYWSMHYQRLKNGCERLAIKLPADEELLSDIKKLDFDKGSSVLKIIISRGQGGRGYSAEGINKATIILTLNPWPEFVNKYQQNGIAVRLCDHRLIINPALAGIKHLNRLDQVLARNEWHNDDTQEGLMLDQAGYILEGISSNVFIMINNKWITAPATECAVAGVIRQAILNIAGQINLIIEERTIQQSEL